MKTVGSWLSKALMLGMTASSLVLGGSIQGGPIQGGPIQGGPIQGGPIQGGPIQGGPYYEAKRFEVAMYPALEPSKLWLIIERATLLGQVRVDVCDEKGKVLFSEWLPKGDTKFHQRFDLSAVGDGTYTFVITDGVQRQERAFRLHTPGLPKRLITLG